MAHIVRHGLILLAAGSLLAACKDAGTDGAPADPPSVASVSPTTAGVMDTITVTGSNFGSVQGSSGLLLNECSTAVIVSWADGQIRAVVPNVAASVTVRVSVNSRVSNGMPLTVSDFDDSNVSYACDIRPILNFGCAISGCHVGPSPVSGFDQSTYSGLRAGGVNYGTDVVMPGDSTNSEIIRAMRGTASVGRMPFGGPWVTTGVPDSLIRRTALWIQQGAEMN